MGSSSPGRPSKPVYLLVQDGKAEIRAAGELWGMDTYEMDDALKAAARQSRRAR